MPPKPPRLTHFLAIPLITPASRPVLAAKLAAFRADPAVRDAIPPDAIRPLGTLHLTLGVFSFPPSTTSTSAENQDRDPLARACALLKEMPLVGIWRAAGRVLAGKNPDEAMPGEEDKPICLTLKGLKSMAPPGQEDMSGVLYAGVEDPTGQVKFFCQAVREAFEREGLMEKEERGLTLHATVVNTVYCKGGRGRGGGRVRVDARECMERWGEEVWVEGMEVGEVAICKMGARRVEGEEGVMEERLGEVYEVVERKEVGKKEEEGRWFESKMLFWLPFELFI